MRIYAYTTLAMLFSTAASFAVADARSLGKDYRTLSANYTMVYEIVRRCPEITRPEMEPHASVEKNLQEKLGPQNYLKFMYELQQSGHKENALKTIDTLWEKIEGCEDPKLEQALDRIGSVHAETFSRFEKEPSLLKAEPVPVPLRK
jgi:hypothetical protein